MKSNRLFLRRRTRGLLFATLLFLLSSCTIGYHEDESFESDVKNATLESPQLENVKVELDATGENATIEWPVVHGAEGYEFSWYVVDDPENPIAVVEGEFIDGCSVELEVEEDTKYKFLIKTIGNKQFNNKDAEKACEISFSTLLETYASIPSGVDLTQWFIDNPLPETDMEPNEDGTLKELAYELEANGEYTISGPIDFGARKVTIRGNKINHSKITFGQSGRILTQNGLKIKFMDFYCNAMEKGSSDASLIGLSKTPNEQLKVSSGEYVIKDPIVIQSCNVYDLNRHLLYDSGKKYCVENFTVKASFIRCNQSNTIVYFNKGSFINITFKESTLCSTVQNESYFAQVNGNRPNKITGYSNGTFNFYNCTVYNLAYSKDFTNWNSYRGQACLTLNFSRTIFVDCGKGDMTNKIMGNANMSRNFEYNTYWYNGSQSNDKYDTNTLDTDPGFINAVNGDFTVTGASQLEKRTGDPRWLPLVEE